MAIKHADVKETGNRGYATEWNKDHIIDSDVDFNKFELLSAAIENRTSFPAAPAIAQVIYRTDRNAFYIYDGTNWIACNIARKTATLVVAANDSVGKYGADYVCDGIADNVEINAALSALSATGGKVILLDGTYNISSAINIVRTGTTLEGQGKGTIISSTADAVAIYSNGVSDMTLIDFSLVNSGTTEIGIRLLNCIRAVVDRIRIILFQRGLRFESSTHCTAKECYIATTFSGIEINSSSYCIVSENITNTPSIDIFIHTNSDYNIVSSNQTVEEIIVADATCDYNLIHGNMSDDAVVNNGTNTLVADNVTY